MNRNTSLLFLKSILALFIILFSTHIFAAVYNASGSGNFNASSTWGGITPSLNAGDDYYIENNKTVNVTTDLILGKLTINSGSTLRITATTDITITVTDLVINATGGTAISMIDCGLNNVTLIITNTLNGAAFSRIQHTPLIGKTQKLVLQGTSNKLYSYTSTGTGGTCIVSYTGGNQNVFNSDNYANLELLGSDTKTLVSTSGSGVEATVKNKLTIKDCILKLNNLNFNYLGTDANLTCTDGWIHTNGTGTYSSNTTEDTRTFPIGDASNMMAVSLTNIAGIKISARLGTNTTGTTIPNSGLGVWYVTPATQVSTKISFLKAGVMPTVSYASNIALYTAAVWKIQPTTYTSSGPTYSTTGTVSMQNTANAFSVFTCPPFTVTPTTLTEAVSGSTYNQTLQVSGGTTPYSLPSSSSTPSTYTLNAQSPDKIKISGTPPTAIQPVTVSFIVEDATGCQSSALSYTIKTKILNVWNGSSWSSTQHGTGVTAVIAGSYSTAQYGDLTEDDIIIQAGGTLIISIGGTITAADSIRNSGTLIAMCGSNMVSNSYDGNAAIYQNVIISPATMPTGVVGQLYSQTFTVAGDASPGFSISNINMPAADYTFTNNTLSFTQSAPKIISFDITYTKVVGANTCTMTETRQIKIIDLPSPNLTIFNIGAKTYGDDPFKVHTYSRSTGNITYQITTPNPCASIDADGIVTITCGGPNPQNIIVVKAIQAASPSYKAATATETFVIKPAAGRFIVRNFAFLVGQSKAITVVNKLNPAPALTFEQLTGQVNATVQADGTVDPIQVGDFSVRISMAATDNYTAFDSTYTFTVRTLQKPPVAVADTIVLEMGKDTTFNILDNDLGMTSEIAPNKTDIDIENDGVQIKFYATELGNFLIDPEGNLTIIPFNGFIGKGRLAYSIADINGLRSEIAYVEVIVNAPYVVPELKVNTTMTPNGDHLNDALVIANTDLAQENSLIIMDEAGNTVYETRNYQNNWEGVDHKNNTLEPGTYFYIFKETRSGRELKNYIQIVK